MLRKTERVQSLSPRVAAMLGFSEGDAETAAAAAGLARADLATGMVMELTALAGVMGRHYAQREGLPPAVCEAVFEAALPRSAGDVLPATPVRPHRRRRGDTRVDTSSTCVESACVSFQPY